jgi:hypothetical protein
VENDDIPNSFSLNDLLFLHGLCGVPLVFDFHHHRFCPGGLSEKEALLAAVKTWPAGVRPVVHWSESQVRGCAGRAALLPASAWAGAATAVSLERCAATCIFCCIFCGMHFIFCIFAGGPQASRPL